MTLRIPTAAGAIAACFVGLVLCGCRHSTSSGPGREGALRIVSMAPSSTEMLFALGVGEQVVGVTNCCDFPPEARRIPQVGGFGTPNMEQLVALSPGLIVTAGLEPGERRRALERSGVAMVDVQAVSFEKLFDGFHRLGRAVGREERAGEIVDRMRADLTAIKEQLGSDGNQRRPRVFVEIWDDPLTTAGGRSFLNDVIARAGGINVAGELVDAYPAVSPEKVLQWNPDVILLAYMSRGGTGAEALAGRIGWRDLPAVKQGRVIDDIPADWLLRPGPRMVEGAKVLARRLHAMYVDYPAAADRRGP